MLASGNRAPTLPLQQLPRLTSPADIPITFLNQKPANGVLLTTIIVREPWDSKNEDFAVYRYCCGTRPPVGVPSVGPGFRGSNHAISPSQTKRYDKGSLRGG